MAAADAMDGSSAAYAGSSIHPTNGKRKREDARDDRKRKDRRVKARKELLEEEFAATYHGVTALYKLLEIKHLQSPLFLPRSLDYRREVTRKKTRSPKASRATTGGRAAPPAVGATIGDIKLGMTQETMEQLKRRNMKIGLLVTVCSGLRNAKGAKQFKPIATSLQPVQALNDLTLEAKLVDTKSSVLALVMQLVELPEDAAAQQPPEFTPVSAESVAVDVAKVAKTAFGSVGEALFSGTLRMTTRLFRSASYVINLAAPSESPTPSRRVQVQFRLTWDMPSKDRQSLRLGSFADRLVQQTFGVAAANPLLGASGPSSELANPKRLDPSLWKEKEDASVVYHYLYHVLFRHTSETRPDYSCAWCNMYAGSLKGLIAHLVCSHSRFRFQVTVGHDNIPHIYVMNRQAKGATAVDGAACENDLDGPLDTIEHAHVHISSRRRGEKRRVEPQAMLEPMHELDELEDLRSDHPQEFYQPLLTRQYFHSRTGAVVLDHEKDYDSDDDVDEEWMIRQGEKLIDEFEDVALEEKEFMKKWNRYVKEHKILADFMVASACRQFATLHGKWLLDHGLRHNFLLHLLNLWDQSLLNSRAIVDCMLIVDDAAKEKTQVEVAVASTSRGAAVSG